MIINPQTKIAVILKQHAGALDAIVSISPKFEKLRNPLLRKLMAGRASLLMASKIGGCSLEDFYDKLEPLGFKVDPVAGSPIEEAPESKALPSFLSELPPSCVVVLDVRPILQGGMDPLQDILKVVRTLKPDQVLKIINSFEPTPLMILLEKQGFRSHADNQSSDLVETWFYRDSEKDFSEPIWTAADQLEWDQLKQSYRERTVQLDVREMEMPLPMLSILEALEQLPENHALYVYHKRVPIFLIPELKERNFQFRILEIGEGEVHLMIFRN